MNGSQLKKKEDYFKTKITVVKQKLNEISQNKAIILKETGEYKS